MGRKPTGIREKILSTAEKLLLEGGIKKLAQPQLAKITGIPQGHITYYFPTRSDLILAIANKSFENMANILQTHATIKDKVKKTVLDLGIANITNRERTRMWIGLLVESDENSTLRAELEQKLRAAKKLMALTLMKDTHDKDTVVYLAFLWGLAIMHYMDHDMTEDDLRSYLQHFIEMSKVEGLSTSID